MVVGSLIVTKDDDDDDDFRHMLVLGCNLLLHSKVEKSDGLTIKLYPYGPSSSFLKKIALIKRNGLASNNCKPSSKNSIHSAIVQIFPSYVDFSRKDGNIIIVILAGNLLINFPICFSNMLFFKFGSNFLKRIQLLFVVDPKSAKTQSIVGAAIFCLPGGGLYYLLVLRSI